MNSKQRNLVAILVGIATLALIIALSKVDQSVPAPSLYWWIFTLLLAYTSSYGIPLSVGEVSLAPMVTVIALLVMGAYPASVSVVIADVLYGLYRWLFPEKAKWEKNDDGYNLVATTSANLTMHTLSVIAAGMVYFSFEGQIPIQTPRDLIILVTMGAAYIITNYITAALFLLMRSRPHLRYLIENLSTMLLYEAIPLVFAPMAAAIWLTMGVTSFLVFAFSLVLASMILRNQASNKLELERHIKELKGLQSVGQSLSAILDEDQIAEAIYREASKLMPTDNFYLALYLPDTNTIHFPITYEHNILLPPRSRSFSNGLTEYVIQTAKPLLIEKNVKQTVVSMGMKHYGQEAISWLGVPLIVGEEVLGMIAVQSYPIANQIALKLNDSNLEILSMIAAQASIALQNARLYTQTDQALAQRVQELNSILNTTSDGIALVDDEHILLQINQSLCSMLGCYRDNHIGQSLSRNDRFKMLNLSNELKEQILDNDLEFYQDRVTLVQNGDIPAERSISPVYGPDEQIDGWLLVFRDLTKEHQLTEFREDLTRMLVHDLRSPVVSIQGGLDMIEVLIEDGAKEELLEMVNISRKGSVQVLGMINELLHLNRLESGKMILQVDPVDLKSLFEEETIFLRPAFQHAGIMIEEIFERGLPFIQADTALLKRVIHNLIDNAIKFTPDEGTITLWAKSDPDDEETILLGVHDNGPGIPEDLIPALFSKHFTIEGKSARRRGTGLGLHFSKLAINAHGGEIWAETEVGKGTNFIIRMPVRQ